MTDFLNSEGPIAAVGRVLLAAGLVAALSIAAGDAMAQKGQPVRLTPLQTRSPPSEQQPNPTKSMPMVIEKLPQTPSLQPFSAQPLVEAAPTPAPVKAKFSRGIEIDSLQSIDPDTVGTLSAARGGLGIDMWRGTSRELVERLLPHLPVNAPSLTMRDLMRRLLLSIAKVPAGPSAGTSLVTLRVKRLAAMGDLVAVNSLLNAIPGQIRDQDLIRVETDSRFLANDNARACPLVASQIRDNDAPYWQKAFAFCQALAGEHDKAALGVGLLRETSDEDEVFFTLFDGLIAGEPPTIQSLADPTPLHLAIARVANAQLPVDVVLSNQPGVLRTVAMSPNASNGLRLEAAELAQAVGVLPIDALRQLYNSIQFSDQDLANPLSRAEVEFGPMVRALLYHTSLIQTVPTAQAEAVARAFALGRDEGRYASTVRVFMPVLKRVPPSAELLWFAPEAARAFLLVGDRAGVSTWFQLMRAAALFNSDAKQALASVLPVARLIGSPEADEWSDRALTEWRNATAKTKGSDARAALLYNLFEGLGENVPDEAWEALINTDARSQVALPDAGIWHRLVQLTEVGVGETQRSVAEMPSAELAPADTRLAMKFAVIKPAASVVAGKTAVLPPAAAVAAPVQKRSTSKVPVGESVLISLLALGNAGPTRAHPLLLRQVLKTLAAAGLKKEARNLAAKAALAAGL